MRFSSSPNHQMTTTSFRARKETFRKIRSPSWRKLLNKRPGKEHATECWNSVLIRNEGAGTEISIAPHLCFYDTRRHWGNTDAPG